MSVIRVDKNKENPYLIMNKTGLNDKNLSLKAKGLLCYFLSLPDNWKIYESELVSHHKDGKDSIRSAIKELLDKGYIERESKRTDKGNFKGYDYTVYEISRIGKPEAENPITENPPLLNNNILSNNKINNKYKDKGAKHKVSLYTFLKDKNDISYDAIEVVKYYIEVYSNYFDNGLKYTEEEWTDIFEDILYSEVHDDLGGSIDTLKEAIDRHFKTEYKHKEMYLLHNFKGTTKDNRLYESGIL